MPLSFTTLGCPEWELSQIIEQAAAYGFDAIDFRGVHGELNIYKLPAFSDQALATRQRIRDAGLEVSCFSSSVHMVSAANYEKNLEEITQYAKLCSLFDTRFIRVFGGSIAGLTRDEAISNMIRHFEEMGKIAHSHGAKLLLETHDDWTSCSDVLSVMEHVNPEYAGVLWDLHHPYRTKGERPEQTWQALSRWVEYVHVKDSRLTPDAEKGFQYCLMGEGDVPIPSMVELLHDNGFRGYYTFEWEKKWHPQLAEPEIAFPQYVQYMRQLHTYA